MSFSKIVIPEMIDILLNNNMNRILSELYFNYILKNRKKYNIIEEDIKLLMTVFCEGQPYNKMKESLTL